MAPKHCPNKFLMAIDRVGKGVALLHQGSTLVPPMGEHRVLYSKTSVLGISGHDVSCAMLPSYDSQACFF